MNTQYRKNLKSVLEASKNYTDKVAKDLRWELGTYDLSVDSDTTSAYQKSVPSGTIDSMVNVLGGMSYKVNQLITEDKNSFVNNYANTINEIANHKLLLTWQQNNNLTNADRNTFVYIDNGSSYYESTSSNHNLNSGNYYWYFTPTSNSITLGYWLASANTNVNISNINLFDLTEMFGSGNEPTNIATATSELLKRGIDVNEYQAYDSGSIRDSAVSSVVSKDSNDTTIDTLTIDNNIQALNGYGWGINDTCYNYIDYETKKFIQKVARVDLGTLTWYRGQGNVYSDNLASVIKAQAYGVMPNLKAEKYPTTTTNNTYVGAISLAYVGAYVDGRLFVYVENSETAPTPIGYLYYELATPVETDISQYITTNKVNVEENGTLTFTNTYNQAVPSDVDYLIEEVKA